MFSLFHSLKTWGSISLVLVRFSNICLILYPGSRQAASCPGTETPYCEETGSRPAADCCSALDAGEVSAKKTHGYIHDVGNYDLRWWKIVHRIQNVFYTKNYHSQHFTVQFFTLQQFTHIHLLLGAAVFHYLVQGHHDMRKTRIEQPTFWWENGPLYPLSHSCPQLGQSRQYILYYTCFTHFVIKLTFEGFYLYFIGYKKSLLLITDYRFTN